MNHADLRAEQDVLVLTGDLDFANVMRVLEKGLAQFNSRSELVFDFSELKTSNSAGLALIIEWMRYARQQNKSIHFRHISPALQSIANAAGMLEIIP